MRTSHILLPVGAIASFGFLAAIYRAYRRDIRKARARISTGSSVVSTERGPIEYASIGDGAPLLVVHGAGGDSIRHSISQLISMKVCFVVFLFLDLAIFAHRYRAMAHLRRKLIYMRASSTHLAYPRRPSWEFPQVVLRLCSSRYGARSAVRHWFSSYPQRLRLMEREYIRAHPEYQDSWRICSSSQISSSGS
jgi:hypothetical protein